MKTPGGLCDRSRIPPTHTSPALVHRAYIIVPHLRDFAVRIRFSFICEVCVLLLERIEHRAARDEMEASKEVGKARDPFTIIDE